jgi:hypothetical protein
MGKRKTIATSDHAEQQQALSLMRALFENYYEKLTMILKQQDHEALRKLTPFILYSKHVNEGVCTIIMTAGRQHFIDPDTLYKFCQSCVDGTAPEMLSLRKNDLPHWLKFTRK